MMDLSNNQVQVNLFCKMTWTPEPLSLPLVKILLWFLLTPSEKSELIFIFWYPVMNEHHSFTHSFFQTSKEISKNIICKELGYKQATSSHHKSEFLTDHHHFQKMRMPKNWLPVFKEVANLFQSADKLISFVIYASFCNYPTSAIENVKSNHNINQMCWCLSIKTRWQTGFLDSRHNDSQWRKIAFLRPSNIKTLMVETWFNLPRRSLGEGWQPPTFLSENSMDMSSGLSLTGCRVD